LSVKLKAIGFDEPCFGYYYTLNGKDWKFAKKSEYNRLDDEINIGGKFSLLVPTFSQAFRWFREKYGVHSSPRKYDETQWWVEWGSWTSSVFGTFEEAEIAWLTKLIEIVKNK
jgi:hypothetical protein